MDNKQEVELQAIKLLALREHSRVELQRKLDKKGYHPDLIVTVLDQLAAQRKQSDARYAEHYVSVRAAKGYGPARIEAELRERGIAATLAQEAVQEANIDWMEQAEQVRLKKFGQPPPADWPGRAKQARFLQYRGFRQEDMRNVLNLG